jgi:phosphatidate cytidylyltransferase
MAADEGAAPSGQPSTPGADRGRRSPLARARRLPVSGPATPSPSRNPPPTAAPLAPAAPQHETANTATRLPPPGEQPRSRAGRNLPAAIGVGLGLGAVVVASLFLSRPSFAVFVGVVLVYACWEFAAALRSAGIRISVVPLMVGGVAALVAAWERGPSGLVVAILVTLVGITVWRVADGATNFARDLSASAFAVLYLPTLAGFAVLLAHPSDGAARELAFVATVVCSDTGGYATGVLFGRHPLAPVVSKAKTWEGFAGSVLACSAAGILFFALTFHQVWWKGLLFGLAIVVTATVGDLGESMIKRDLGIKDMGRLLPGHGGLMDRLDSLLPCAAVAYLLLTAFAPV